MSGGRFNYKDHSLDEFASEIEYDIVTNDNEDGGLQASVKTLHFMRKMVDDLHRICDILHAYDWYVSGDTCEETFLEKAEEIYGDKQ